MNPVFHSRNLAYRCPVGAVSAGTEIFFRICIPRALDCSGARMHVEDASSGQIYHRGMFWAGMNGDCHEWWDCRFTPETPSLFRYWFELTTPSGSRRLSRLRDGSADIVSRIAAPHSEKWQITCYAGDFTTPDWPVGGVMYQIFPDRFANSGTPKSDVPTDRKLHTKWGEPPQWWPDSDGEIYNNDYFGGDLRGIEQRLDRLAELGVTCLYLNPIFEAHSNHRYDTADYEKIDPLLGTQEDFESLLRTAAQLGMRVLLDGVFSHTGADSVYFNKNKRYSGDGAAQSLTSPYASWYRFNHWPYQYNSWWGFKTLPDVDETDPGFLNFTCGETGIVRRRISEGAGGWRLDVADELPDEFLDALRTAVKAEDPDAMVLGEVWEDASHKESYGSVRRYLFGGQLDSVMNYPFRAAIIRYLCGGNAMDAAYTIMDIVENYPPQVTRILMNMLSTHDTERILTMLAGESCDGKNREWQASHPLSGYQRAHGMKLVRLATAMQYTLPGIPCIYYGDEAGMEGYRDPFNRGCYPWGNEDTSLMTWHRRLGQLRRSAPALREGNMEILTADRTCLIYERVYKDSRLLCAVNSGDMPMEAALPEQWHGATISMGEGRIEGGTVLLPPVSCAIAVL